MRRFVLLFVLLAASCQALSAPTPTGTPTLTPSLTPTSAPTATPTALPATATPSSTPTVTDTPTITPTPTLSPTPSLTPQPVAGFVFDNWKLVQLPTNILSLLQTPTLAFINTNDRDGLGDTRTPQPATNVQTLYYVPPTNSGGRIAVLQTPSSTGRQVFISANGLSVAYFLDTDTPQTTGLYVLDVASGISGRILPIASLVQRGKISQPVWSPGGERLALALATGYDMDIFVIGRDGTNPENLTNSGAYEFWPAWSPDSARLLFVSDRNRCPSWIPGEPGACDALLTPEPPTGGNVFVLEFASGELTQLSDQWVTEAPRWLNNRQVTFASGDPTMGDPERTLWIADAATGQTREVKLADGTDSPLRLAEAWSPDGGAVVYQSAGTTTEIIVASVEGRLLGRTSELTFARFGMAAAWSPDGQRVAVGGAGGQCPNGVSVFDRTLTFVGRRVPPPSMCEPIYSPDGQFLAFTGIVPNVDGRVDVYAGNFNGQSAANLTGSLKGTITLLGWVGGQ